MESIRQRQKFEFPLCVEGGGESGLAQGPLCCLLIFFLIPVMFSVDIQHSSAVASTGPGL